MKRNRRSQSASIRLVPALNALFLCLFFGGAAVGYVWQHRQLHDLSATQRALEARLELLKRDNRQLAVQLADLQLPYRIQERVRQQRLMLNPAVPGQLVLLSEPLPASESTSILGGGLETRARTLATPGQTQTQAMTNRGRRED